MTKKTLQDQAEELRAQIQPGDSTALAKEAGVSSRWIRYFKDGAIPNPGVLTLDALAKAIRVVNKGR